MATGDSMKQVKRVGEFLVEKKIITPLQLVDALELQKDNRERLLGEILVTQGVLTKEQLIMALQLYLIENDVSVTHVDEWLDQEEVDMILERLQNK